MCFPYDQCRYCGNYGCENLNEQGCACCSCYWGAAVEYYCPSCREQYEQEHEEDDFDWR